MNVDRSKFTHEVKVSMPDLGDSDIMDDDDAFGVVDKWYKKEGDVIKQDDVICDIRTKLFTFGMMTDDDYDSIMGEILVPEGSDPVKLLVARLSSSCQRFINALPPHRTHNHEENSKARNLEDSSDQMRVRVAYFRCSFSHFLPPLYL